MGTEFDTLLLPDFLDAFFEWINGRPLAECSGYINPTTRLFPNAIRVAGWCHAFGNLMKKLRELIPQWPRVQAQMSCMCKKFQEPDMQIPGCAEAVA